LALPEIVWEKLHRVSPNTRNLLIKTMVAFTKRLASFLHILANLIPNFKTYGEVFWKHWCNLNEESAKAAAYINKLHLRV
jgi:hypothetical protein